MKIVSTPDGTLAISDSDYNELLKRRSREYIESVVLRRAIDIDAEESKKRFNICKTCDNAYDDAYKCKQHTGCCFGRFRSLKASKCPCGKW